MLTIRTVALCAMAIYSIDHCYAATVKNMSFEGKYKTTAHICKAGRCEDQSETVTSAFFVSDRNAYVYSGENKGLVLPFGQRKAASDGKNLWLVPTPVGLDEVYARDGFTIKHHYEIHPDGTCSISVSVVKAPATIDTTYRTEMESCKVAEGNIFASQ